MDRQLSKLMSMLLLALVLWFAFSMLNRISTLLPLLLLLFAIANVISASMVREAPGAVAKLSKNRLMRAYFRFVCHMIGDDLPTESSAKTSRRKLLLRTPQEYRAAANQAKQLVRGQDEIIDVALARVKENQTLRKNRHDERSLPLAAFFLVGNEGIGKRYLARVLSKLIYGNATVDVFDCSRLSSAMLVGTQDQPGELIQLIRQRSHRTVFFENLESTDSDTARLFQTILSKGAIHLTGSRQAVRFDNTLFFFSTTIAVSQLRGLATTKGLDTTMTQNGIELLANASGINTALLNSMTDVYLFQAVSDRVKAEVLSLLLQQECRSHKVNLAYVDPVILASQVCRLEDQNGFGLAPQIATRLLRKPLVAAAAEGHDALALRVRRATRAFDQEPIRIG